MSKNILGIMSKVRGKTVKDIKIDIRINEVKNPELSAYLVAERIAGEMERRVPHRRAVQKAIERVMAAGALGIKVVVGGRINGAEISRVEKFHEGSVPSQTLREDIDYAQVPALLKRGYVGVKVWIHRKAES
jgi:small subunit ribosomal protein S3